MSIKEGEMTEIEIEIVNKLGLHARASSKLVQLANRYRSKITIKFNNSEVNAKSLLGLLTIAASKGSVIKIIADGEDEEKAINAIEKLIKNKFGEKE